jgi:hypothetical protein
VVEVGVEVEVGVNVGVEVGVEVGWPGLKLSVRVKSRSKM